LITRICYGPLCRNIRLNFPEPHLSDTKQLINTDSNITKPGNFDKKYSLRITEGCNRVAFVRNEEVQWVFLLVV